MDIFSPSICSEAYYAEGTNNEQHAWFYKRIIELNSHLSALDTSLNKASQMIGDNSSKIDANKQSIAEIRTKLQTLASNFTNLSIDNTSFKEQINASFSDLSKLVSGYNAAVNKLDTTTASNTDRITKLENTIDPNRLNAILAKVNGLDAEIQSAVSSKVDQAIGSVKADLNTTISSQNKAISSINDLVNQSNNTAAQALNVSNKTSSDLSNLDTKLTSQINSSETTLKSGLAQEIVDRGTSIDNVNNTLSKKISDISTQLTQANTDLTKAINTEIKNRASSDDALSYSITDLSNSVNQQVKAVNSRIDNTDKNLASEKQSRINGDSILDAKIDTLNSKVETNYTEYKKNKEITDDTDIQLDRKINTETERATAKEKEIVSTATQDRSNTKQTFDTLSQSIIDWALGTGEDYHLKTDAIKGSIGTGLKGTTDALKANVSAISSKVDNFVVGANARLDEFDAHLKQDEVAIKDLHLYDDKQDKRFDKDEDLIRQNQDAIMVNKTNIALNKKAIETNAQDIFININSIDANEMSFVYYNDNEVLLLNGKDFINIQTAVYLYDNGYFFSNGFNPGESRSLIGKYAMTIFGINKNETAGIVFTICCLGRNDIYIYGLKKHLALLTKK